EVILAPVLAEHVAGQGDRTGRLAGPRRTREEEVGKVSRLRIGLEALDDLLLADDLVQALRSILLDPEFLHRRPNARRIRRLRNKPLAGDAPDAQDLRSDESRLDRLGDRGVDEVRPAAREALEAPAGGMEERPEQPRKEARDRPGLRLLELDRHEVDEAGDRVLQSPAIGG